MGSGETRSSRIWLPALNFFVADVRDGLGPFLGVFLMGHGWKADDIGYVMTIGGIAGMLATTPFGALVDATRAKRMLLGVASVLVVIGSLVILLSPSFLVTAVSQVCTGIVGAVIGPAIAGITLGLVGQQRLPAQIGTNEAWNHAGNLTSAALAGMLGYYFGLPAVFLLMAVMAGASLICIWRIHPIEIDHDVARGATENGLQQPQSALSLLRTPTLLLIALTMMLFHLGNAAMLPLLGQAMVSRHMVEPATFTAATVIVAQLVMIPVAVAAGRYASKHGYHLLILIALLALPLRGALAGAWDSPWALLPVQILDGVGAGLLGVALPGIVARLLSGSGHINIGLGAVMTVQGIGAALSTTLGGFIAARYGYDKAFWLLGATASIGLLTWALYLRVEPGRHTSTT
ncbi:MFS transporter [uncultured Oxalicibacterium sp.]|uniref:MFS transporter n=1 Tax=uncultured Oxalicibacterium sp. TaxID=1168540 RepID=UPI0025D3003D|nr:MFS transporter [uncultured Oxalicibacterium sp.]